MRPVEPQRQTLPALRHHHAFTRPDKFNGLTHGLSAP